MTDALSDLGQRWLDALGPNQGCVLRSVDALPELRDAFTPAQGLEPVIASESYVQWTGTALEGALLLAWETAGTGVRVGTVSVDFDTAEGTASLEDMHLVAGLQGNGAGRLAVQRIADLAEALGLHSLKTMAFDVGRYSWARCGFDFLDDQDRERVLTAAADFAAGLNRDFDADGIDHSWDLATLDGSDVPLADVAALRGDPPPAEEGPPMRFGQALLLGPKGNEWAGCLELASGSLSRIQLLDEEA